MSGGDDGLGAVGDGIERLLHAEDVGMGVSRQFGGGGAAQVARRASPIRRSWTHDVAEGGQIEPDAEMRPLRRKDYRPNVRVRSQLGHRGRELGEEGHVHGVAFLGAVEKQRGDVGLALDGEHFVVAGHEQNGSAGGAAHPGRRRGPPGPASS